MADFLFPRREVFTSTALAFSSPAPAHVSAAGVLKERSLSTGTTKTMEPPVIFIPPPTFLTMGALYTRDRFLSSGSCIAPPPPAVSFSPGSLISRILLPKYTPEDTAALLIRGNVFDFDFVGVPVFGVEPVTVLFTAVGFTPTDYWHWNFGDGFTAVGATVSHTYSAGVYDVTLTTGALLWGFSSRTKLQYVRVLRTPFVGRRVDFTEFVIEGSEAVVQVIPMRSNPCFTEEVELDSVPYLFKFYWSVKSSAWFFDISTNGTLLAAGLPLRIGVDAFSRRRHISGMPKGTLLVVDVSNRLSDPIAFDDFTGARGLQLVYSPVEEA